MVFPRRSFNRKRGDPLPSLRKLLVKFKGCNYGNEGLRLTLGDDPSCQGMGSDAREINTKREGAWDFSPLSAETGGCLGAGFSLVAFGIRCRNRDGKKPPAEPGRRVPRAAPTAAGCRRIAPQIHPFFTFGASQARSSRSRPQQLPGEGIRTFRFPLTPTGSFSP